MIARNNSNTFAKRQTEQLTGEPGGLHSDKSASAGGSSLGKRSSCSQSSVVSINASSLLYRIYLKIWPHNSYFSASEV